jgi:hypothetical protein
MAEMRNDTKYWSEKPEWKRPLEDLDVDGRIIFENTFEK